ncbi:YeeE/YedE family protein [Marinoscillum sp. 108]|jgi:uncharacterized protein|uniref:YeeE/YedE family protein n=1 Tax=Marinoscillum luteum TaxID=861051 RepID=A0ABW7N574_9BACT|nr:YeeE/YedE thiosulfate transporter family protein [Marinoscillum sp. 108]VXD10765.1 YeeE/YedE family protein [Marinoscillum sp. 108]
MKEILDFVSQPWPWYVAGPLIALVMFTLIIFGNNFGISANLRTVCSIVGAGKNCEFFDFNWKSQLWNLVFAFGLVLGGLITHQYLTTPDEVTLSAATLADLAELGIEAPRDQLVPLSIFSWESLATVRGFIILVVGGFLIGFGTRYAGGCTSGHAISGLSDLQLPSLIAVVGFFIGGLFMTYLVLPYLFTL